MTGGMFGPDSRFLEHMKQFAGAADEGDKTGKPLTREEAAAVMANGPIEEKAGDGPG